MASIEILRVIDPPRLEVRFSIEAHEATTALGRADDFDGAIIADLEDGEATLSDRAQALSHLLLLIERGAG